VGPVERLPEGGHGLVRAGFHRQLEGLAGVAQVEGRAQLGPLVAELFARACGEAPDGLADVLLRERRSGKEHALHDVAPMLGEHEADR
jgi:hypothetical protein